jgi:hypothetical protein
MAQMLAIAPRQTPSLAVKHKAGTVGAWTDQKRTDAIRNHRASPTEVRRSGYYQNVNLGDARCCFMVN